MIEQIFSEFLHPQASTHRKGFRGWKRTYIFSPDRLKEAIRWRPPQGESLVICFSFSNTNNLNNDFPAARQIWGYDVTVKQVSRILKERLNFVFKKAASRPLRYQPEKTDIQKCIFAARVCRLLNHCMVIINVDEETFTRTTKQNYTWMVWGRPGVVRNEWIKGSRSLVSWIMSTGCSYSLWVKGTINSEVFLEYLKWLKAHLDDWLSVPNEKVWIIMNNSPVHTAGKVLQYLKESSWNYIFLPAYCPEFAPVELYFGQLKKKVIANTRGCLLNLEDSKAQHTISGWILDIGRPEVLAIWRNFYSCMKDALLTAHILIEK